MKMAPNGVSHYAADYRLVECLRERYPPQLMPIQVSVWREFSSGLLERDLQIIASTGRGKTLSYTLPLLDALSKYTYRQDRALVIVPSGELANQVATVFHPFAEAISATVKTCRAQPRSRVRKNVRLRRLQQYLAAFPSLCRKGLREKATCSDVWILTPSQVRSSIDAYFTQFRTCVIDEADKLIRQQHQGWLAHTNSRLFVRNNPHIIPVGERARKKVRTFLVSATLCVHGTDAQRISTHALQNVFESDELSGPFLSPTLKEFCLVNDTTKKLEVLRLVLQLFKGQSVIIITSSVNSCCDIWQEIKTSQPSLLPVKYSSASSKSEQKASLEAFRNGSCKIMVASDAAARGLDVSGVKLVISYDVPDSAETYAHRVGRTARAGTDGIAMTFCRKSETEHYKKVTSFVNRHSPAVFLDVKDLFSNGISGAFSALLHHL